MEHIKNKIRTIPHFPKQGVMFRDITTLLQDADGLRDVTKEFKKRYEGVKIDKIVGIEARGFIFGGALAHEMGIGFVPIRKKGKLPFKVIREEYMMEYRPNIVEVHEDAIKPGEKVLLVDDLVATGGSCLATCRLIEKLGGKIIECAFIIDLPELGGKKKIEDAGYKVFNMIEFEGE